jgi:hypothetical protein
MAQSWHCTSPTCYLVSVKGIHVACCVPRAFIDPSAIVTSTLLGVISQHSLRIEGKAESWGFQSVLLAQTQSIAKVNGLVAQGDNVAVGGLTADGRGAAELYQYDSTMKGD